MAEMELTGDDLTFGDRLQVAIRSTGLSQATVARRLGVSPGFLSEVVRGRKRPGEKLLLALGTEFGFSADWLLMGRKGAAAKIRPELFDVIRVQTGLVHAALIHRDPVAAELLDLLLKGEAPTVDSDTRYSELLERVGGPRDANALFVDFYNAHANVGGVEAESRALLTSVVEFYRNKISRVSLLVGKDKATPVSA